MSALLALVVFVVAVVAIWIFINRLRSRPSEALRFLAASVQSAGGTLLVTPRATGKSSRTEESAGAANDDQRKPGDRREVLATAGASLLVNRSVVRRGATATSEQAVP
jgi:membrane protein implicated in regulation of membrane protease activity